MFIQTESTPNPNTRKFLPGKPVLPVGTLEFSTEDSARISPLACRLFSIPEVSNVFLGQDFISVTKKEGEWVHLNPAILGAIMEYYVSGEPMIRGAGDSSAVTSAHPPEEDVVYTVEDKLVVEQIKDLLRTRVEPAVQNDGGTVVFRAFKDGIVYLEMKGACRGCPSSSVTLQNGIRNLLSHFIPEVQDVRPWSDSPSDYLSP